MKYRQIAVRPVAVVVDDACCLPIQIFFWWLLLHNFFEWLLPSRPQTTLQTVLDTYLNKSPKAEKAERQYVADKIRKMGSLTPTDEINFSYRDKHPALSYLGYAQITSLPEGFKPQGNVSLFGCTGLTYLPEGFNPQGDVCLGCCDRLTSLPEGFNPQGRYVSLRGCTGLTYLPEAFNPEGDVDLWGCTGLRSLPDVFKPQGKVDLSGCSELRSLPKQFNPQGRYVSLRGCTGLTSLPEGFNPQGNVDLSGCFLLRSLPERFNPQGNVNLSGCTGLTCLPEGFNPKGNVDLRNCILLTAIPESLFNMPSRSTNGCSPIYVDLINTSLSARVVADIIQRMNTPGYNGPRFVLSVAHSDYRTESDASANNLPSILDSAGHRSNDPLWTVAQSQTGMGSQWNILAKFLTRLLNETPRSEGQVPPQLNATLGGIFTAMEREFAANDHQLEPCEFINSTLAAAQSGIGTCIDKVKVGYVMMQLQLKKVNGDPSAERNIERLGRTIELVEGINRSDYVFDMGNSRFEKVLIEVRELSDYDTSMVCTVKIDGIERQYTLAASMSESDIKQFAISEINGETETRDRFRAFRIGDEVEDILNLTYALPEMHSLHRIDMRFLGCRTMTEPSDVDAAIRCIRG